MVRRFFFALVLGFAALSQALALGPVDGLDLAATDLERVAIGGVAPGFVLEDEQGKTLSLEQLRGAKNVILVFYRGHW
jgi:cytochrome oxidase Cu insertion factor (SCO1/SenC/PrrC family)